MVRQAAKAPASAMDTAIVAAITAAVMLMQGAESHRAVPVRIREVWPTATPWRYLGRLG